MAAGVAGAGSRAEAGAAAGSASPASCRRAPCCWRCSRLSSPPWSPAAGRVGGGGARRHHQRRAARGEEGAAAPPRPRSSGAAASSACIPPRALEGRLSRDCLRPRGPACSRRSRSCLSPERTFAKRPVSLGPEHPAEDCGQARREGAKDTCPSLTGSPLRHSGRQPPAVRLRGSTAGEPPFDSCLASSGPLLQEREPLGVPSGIRLD